MRVKLLDGLRFVTVFGCLVLVCSAQEITVRLVNADNGEGLSGRTIWVQFYHPDRTLQRVERKTGQDGAANFQLTDPILRDVVVITPAGRLTCGALLTETLENILNHGATASSPRCAPASSVTRSAPKPGEVLLFARPMSWLQSWWRRLLEPVERE